MIENPFVDGRYFDNLPSDVRHRFLDEHKRGLTILQQMAFPVVRWLLFGQRASGRTTLLAHVYIEEALKTGQWVEIGYDHHSVWHRDKARLIDRIQEVLMSRYRDCEYRLRMSDDALIVRKRR